MKRKPTKGPTLARCTCPGGWHIHGSDVCQRWPTNAEEARALSTEQLALRLEDMAKRGETDGRKIVLQRAAELVRRWKDLRGNLEKALEES